MTHLKDHLEHLHAELVEVEQHARKLPNQNFADIVASAHKKLAQVMTHPDLDAVHEQASKVGDAGEKATAGALFPGAVAKAGETAKAAAPKP